MVELYWPVYSKLLLQVTQLCVPVLVLRTGKL